MLNLIGRWVVLGGIFLPTMTYAYGDKGSFDLFRPTPPDLMRELSTDRPDQTESAYTVDAGHYQIEADIIKHTFDRHKVRGKDVVDKSWNIAPVNLKAGLTNDTDLQVVLDDYLGQVESDKVAGTREKKHGFGDVTIRLKHNFWGDDGGRTAFALMPFVKLPTNQHHLGNDQIEGGLLAPFAFRLSDGFDLSTTSEVDILKDADDRGYHPAVVNSASLGVEWTESLAAYYEIFTEKGTDSGDRWVVSLDTGFTYALAKNIQLDAGINVGVTKAADNYQPFVGASYRF